MLYRKVYQFATPSRKLKLKQLKTGGRTGYFHKGELKVRTEKDDGITDSVKSRMFLNANRRLVPPTIQSDHEHMEEGTSVDAAGASAAFNDKYGVGRGPELYDC